jgi:hypothetical protein
MNIHVIEPMGNLTPRPPAEKCYTVSRAFVFWAVGLGIPVLIAAFWKIYDLGIDRGSIKFDSEKNELVTANISLRRVFDNYRDSISHVNSIAAIAVAITEQGAIRDKKALALQSAIKDAIHHNP